MSGTVRDMTRGSPAKLILSFAFPLMLGNVCQQLYTIVDTIVVGQAIGVEALAAVGAADWLNWMVLGITTGFTQGFSILVSQRFGAENYSGMRKAVTMSVLLASVIAVVLTAVSQASLELMLRFLNTPENIFDGAALYLRVSFSGVAIIMAYNVLASVLRALGDGKTPLFAMLIAAIINIGLDLLFVMGFQWGIGGAAAATVIAQIFSGLFCLRAVLKISILRIQPGDWEVERATVLQLFRLGVPMAFQNIVIAVGGLAVQYVINGFGFIFVAGFTATNKLYGLLELAATSFGFSMATFTGQNLGAGRIDRIQSGMRSALKMAVVTALLISAVMVVFGKFILGMFISGTPHEVAQVMNIAYTYLLFMSALLFVLYLLHLYRSALQGMGDTVIPMVSGIVELVMRIVIVLLLPHLIGVFGIYFAEIAAWLGAELLLMFSYYRRIRLLSERIPIPDGVCETAKDGIAEMSE